MAVLRLNGELMMVESLEEASRIVRADIDATGVGSEEWYSHGRFQGVVRDDGKVIGRISYNGRIWEAPWRPGRIAEGK